MGDPAVPGPARLAHDDDLDGVFLGEGPDGAGDVGAAPLEGYAAELMGQFEILAQDVLGRRVDAGEVFRRSLNVKGVPGRVESVGDSRSFAKERRGVRAQARDADHDPVGGRDRGLVRLGPSRPAIDQVGDLGERELAEPGQVHRREEVFKRYADPILGEDLAGLQPLDEVFDRDVDVDNLIGIGEDAVGEPLLDLDAGGVFDLVVQTLEMLNVDVCDDVDARQEQVLDVLVPLGVLAAGNIGAAPARRSGRPWAGGG